MLCAMATQYSSGVLWIFFKIILWIDELILWGH